MGRATKLLSAVAICATAVLCIGAGPALATEGAQEANTVKVKPAGISLRVPKPWVKADLTKESLDQIADSLAAQNPDLADQIHEFGEFTAEGSKFYAIDLTTGNSASVVVAPGGSDGFPSDVATFREDYEAEALSDGDTIVSAKRVKFAGNTAFRVVMRRSVISPEGEATPLLIGQVFLRHGDDLVVVTVGAGDDETGTQTADAVLDSVEPLSRKASDRSATSHA
jgi:hypothetical protein